MPNPLDREMTIKEIALGFRHRLNGLTPRDGLMVPFNGMRLLLDELQRLWALEDTFTKATTQKLVADEVVVFDKKGVHKVKP